MKHEYQLHGRIWIKGPKGTFLGYGRVILLEQIREHGSISAAARAMKMSYRRAWKLVDSMNNEGSSPVVVSSAGGRGGGGAELTATGTEAIETFWSAFTDFQAFLAKRTAQINP